jgi:hypothetical protein
MAAWKKYDYLLQTDRKHPGHYVYRPVVDVRVSGPTGGHSQIALVDSGTEITMLDAEIAEVIGIDKTKCLPGKASGIGGTKNAFIGKIALTIDGFDETDYVWGSFCGEL